MSTPMSNRDSMVGRQVEQYLVEQVIKVGGMGAVYRAVDTMIDTPVALKFILSDFDDNPDMAKRFVQEAKTLARLNLMNCPNIPLLYRYFIWEGKAVMAMEYVSGETLEDLVRRRGPIPANVSVPLVKQALHGLCFAHRIGVIHRDLKPGNLMLNGEGTVKVIDFGIAKKIEVEVGLTRTNMAIGTPLYMAPEQIMGKPITARTDIYLMGLVLYELLAGQVPFSAVSDFEISSAHVQQIPDPPTIHYPHIPRQVVDAVMKALQKNPDNRFASAEEFIAALGDVPAAQAAATLPATLLPASAPLPGVATSPSGVRIPPYQTPNPAATVYQPSTAQQPYTSQPYAQPQHESYASSATAAGGLRAVDVPPASGRGSANKALIAAIAGCFLLLIAGAGIWWVNIARDKESVPRLVAANQGTTTQQTPVPEDTGPSTATDVPAIPNKPPASKKQPAAPSNPPKQGGTTTDRAGANRPGNGNVQTPVVPPQPVAGQELSGVWQGTYADSRSPQDKTLVRLQLKEVGGEAVAGTLKFTKADNTTGQCDLSKSTYSAQTQKLQLLLHCSGPAAAPGYFNTPTSFNVSDPTERSLTGRILYSFPSVIVDIRRE